jgi:hypothetical protein
MHARKATAVYHPETFIFPNTANDFKSKAQYLIDVFGNEIKTSFKNKSFTLGVAFNDRLADVINVKIKANSWHELALKMIIENNRGTKAYIANIHAYQNLGLTGTFIVKFAIEFMERMGVKEATIYDAARVTYDANDPKFHIAGVAGCWFGLSSLLMISDRTTFYGKFGFRPRRQSVTMRLCGSADRLRTLAVKDIFRMACQIDKVVAELATAAIRESMLKDQGQASVPTKASFICVEFGAIIDLFRRYYYKNANNKNLKITETLAGMRRILTDKSKIYKSAKQILSDLVAKDPDATLLTLVKRKLACEQLFYIERILSVGKVKNTNGSIVYNSPFYKDFAYLFFQTDGTYKLVLGAKPKDSFCV